MEGKKRFFPSPLRSPNPAETVPLKEALFVEDEDEILEVEPHQASQATRNGSAQQLSVDVPQTVPRREPLPNNLEAPTPAEPLLSDIGFELFQSQLLSVIGDASMKAMRHLYAKYFNRPNYIQLASNEYFNGISFDDESSGEASENVQEDKREELKQVMERMNTEARNEAEMKKAMGWKRYIGTLDVQAWATRPYLRSLRYQQELQLKRLIPNKMKKLSIVASKFGDSAVIRLYTSEADGSREIGRLPEDITRILSPLIDLEIANFSASVIMETKGRLSIGDPFFLQIKCYLNNNTFVDHGQVVGEEENSQSKRRKTAKLGITFSQETEAEAALRLKQKSISRLFDKLSIIPYDKSSVNTDAEEIPDDDSSVSSTPKPEIAPTEELSLEQLKQFYTANQQSDFLENLPETTTPPEENFALTLRPYQKHGLSWMLSREKELDLLEELSVNNSEVLSTQKRQAIRNQDDEVMDPLWSTFKWPQDPANPDLLTSELEFFYANLYNGELSTEKPVLKSFLKGGILADEMGLGKTILTLSLIHSVPYDSATARTGTRNYASKTTLIIVPMSLLSQWKKEFDRSNKNSNHRCHIYYGDLVQTDLSLLLCNRSENIPIVLLTTYGTVQSEWTRINKLRDANGKLPKIGLFSVEFFRIVVDEGHNIRNRTTKTAKSVHELELRRKWILTGTPVVNRLDDIFSLVKFLRLEPWSNFSYWKTFVTLPFEQKKFQQTLDVVKSILQPIFLRRTKNMKQKDGTPLIDLPSKEVVVEELEFSDREQLFYDFFKSRAYNSFKEGLKSGELLKKYTQILTHILRLRQVCCHPDLVAASSELDDSWKEELAAFEEPIKKEKFWSETMMKEKLYSLYAKVHIEDSECSICTQAPISIGELTLTECGHQYCFHCILEHIEFQTNNGSEPLCPDCRHPISKYRLFKVLLKSTSKKKIRFHTKEKIDDIYSNYDFHLYYYDPDKSSTKIEALISHLRALKEQSPGEQVVVFSQFSSYLDLIENELKLLDGGGETEFSVYKFDGRLNLNERDKILQQFVQKSEEGKITVLLLSLKAGGVGLNLTCANKAFMMDPWWSPSIEDQAIDRIHRIGQEQNVKVTRFVVKNSIETKMLKIQERKRMMGEAVEVEEEERRRQRIEDIKLLFDE